MLYQNEGIYLYRAGINWRAAVTLLVVVPVNLPGLINAINPKVPIGNFAYFCTSLPSSCLPHLLPSQSVLCIYRHIVPRHMGQPSTVWVGAVTLINRSRILADILLHLDVHLIQPIQDLAADRDVCRADGRIARRTHV